MSWNHKGRRIETGRTEYVRINGGGIETRAPYIFDHFAEGAGALNSRVPQHWVTAEAGTGTVFAPGATGNTYLTGVTGGTTNNGEELAGKGVLWNPSTMGGLIVEARLKFEAATTPADGDLYFGLNDAVTESALPYVVSAASALTTHAPTDSAMFAYTSIATSGALFLSGGNHFGMVSSKADVDTVTAPSVSVVKDTSFHIFRIECDTSANCSFFIDDNCIGSVAAAFTANTAMTPYLAVVAKASHAVTCVVDWLYISAGSYV